MGKENHADIVLCENTGGYETSMLLARFHASVPVRAVNPTQIKRDIESLGTGAKTDKTDAKRIAMFARERQPEPLQSISSESVVFNELLAFYRQLVLERSRLKNQLKQTKEPFVIKQTKSMIEHFDKQIKKARQELQKFIADNAEWKAKQEILKSVPGIGEVVSTVLLAELPELGSGSADRVSALVGVVPMTCQSGVWKGKSRIVGGRGTVRCALYEAVMSAVYHCKTDNVFKRLFKRLTEVLKKPFKMAMVAVMHKMVQIVHALLKKEEKWNQQMTI
jgi:transposase